MKKIFSGIIAAIFLIGIVFSVQVVSADSGLSGKVVETMNSAGYTYVCLEKGGKKTWIAVPEMKVTKGQNMTFQPGAEMVNFESKTLKRKFDKIIFSSGPVAK